MGKDGILETVQEGALLIDSSTVDPSVSQAVAAAAAGIYGLHDILIVNIFIYKYIYIHINIYIYIYILTTK
jgi:hypothetical protein